MWMWMATLRVVFIAGGLFCLVNGVVILVRARKATRPEEVLPATIWVLAAVILMSAANLLPR